MIVRLHSRFGGRRGAPLGAFGGRALRRVAAHTPGGGPGGDRGAQRHIRAAGNLGVIVVDEEHEIIGQSDHRPRYDAREVARGSGRPSTGRCWAGQRHALDHHSTCAPGRGAARKPTELDRAAPARQGAGRCPRWRSWTCAASSSGAINPSSARGWPRSRAGAWTTDHQGHAVHQLQGPFHFRILPRLRLCGQMPQCTRP